MGIGDDTAPNALSRHTHKTKKVINVDILFFSYFTAAADRIHRVGEKKKRKRKRLYSQSLNETQSITNRIALVITAV
jgi:hypothetical protein